MSEQKKPTSEESVGHITNDSLAAQSLRAGGDFASGDATPHGVPSKSTTANTTDTSGAAVLPAAPDAATRDAPGAPYMQSGTTFDRGGGAAAAPASVGGASAVYDTSKGGPQAAHGGAAPTYTNQPAAGAPHGKNITEGGFDPALPNASFAADIGSRQDPARLREAQLVAANERSGEDHGRPDSQVAGAGEGHKGGFEKLDERRA